MPKALTNKAFPFESLPPLTKLSKLSKAIVLLIWFLYSKISFSKSSKVIPDSINLAAFNTINPSPTVTFLESITTISSLSNSALAKHADW